MAAGGIPAAVRLKTSPLAQNTRPSDAVGWVPSSPVPSALFQSRRWKSHTLRPFAAADHHPAATGLAVARLHR
jgi:hypothetical protein